MTQQTVPLPAICRKAGVSVETGRRYLRDYNASRAPQGHHRFNPDEVPSVLGIIASKRKRKCRNAFNSSPMENTQ